MSSRKRQIGHMLGEEVSAKEVKENGVREKEGTEVFWEKTKRLPVGVQGVLDPLRARHRHARIVRTTRHDL